MLTTSRTFNIHEDNDIMRRRNDLNNDIERSIIEYVKSNRKIETEINFQTKHSIKVITIIDDNRKVIDESSKNNVTSNRQVNVKGIEPFSPSFFPLDNKYFKQVSAKINIQKN